MALGLAVTAANLDLPIIRNSDCYAKAAVGLLQHDFNIAAIVASDWWTGGKPILFSLLAAPFVALSGANAGVIAASALGTAFFLWTALIALERLNDRARLPQNLLWLELLFVAFNPLVIYQFWSAYPDSLFAGLVLLAFVLTDIIATEPARDTRWHIVGLGMVILLALHTKLYGAILGFTCPLYLLLHARRWFGEAAHSWSKLALLGMIFAGLGVVLLATKMEINPWLRLDNGAGVGEFAAGVAQPDIGGSLLMMLFALLLNAQFALLFLLRRDAWRAVDWAPLLFAAIYLAGLAVFPGTNKNMRYFLPVIPFIAVALTAGARQMPHRAIIFGAYALCGALLIALFNVATAEHVMQPVLGKLTRRHHTADLLLDNLRLPGQIALERQIAILNATVPDGSTLYWQSDYNGEVTHGLAYQLGVKASLDVRYVMRGSQIPSSVKPAFLIDYTGNSFGSTVDDPPGWASVEPVGKGIFRLDPVSRSERQTARASAPFGG